MHGLYNFIIHQHLPHFFQRKKFYLNLFIVIQMLFAAFFTTRCQVKRRKIIQHTGIGCCAAQTIKIGIMFSTSAGHTLNPDALIIRFTRSTMKK